MRRKMVALIPDILSRLQWDVFVSQILTPWIKRGLDFSRISELETGGAGVERWIEAVSRENAPWQDVARCLSFKPPRAQIGQVWQGLACCISRLKLLPNHLNPDMSNICCLSTGPPWRSAAGKQCFLSQVRPSRHGPSGAWSVRQTLFHSQSPGFRITNKNTPGALWFSCGPAVQEKGCLPQNHCLRCNVV